jgi:tRNA A37 threonylcarbamoyladenosine dehydratase
MVTIQGPISRKERSELKGEFYSEEDIMVIFSQGSGVAF